MNTIDLLHAILCTDPSLLKVACFNQVSSKLFLKKTTIFIFSLYSIPLIRVNDQPNAYNSLSFAGVRLCTTDYFYITVALHSSTTTLFFSIDQSLKINFSLWQLLPEYQTKIQQTKLLMVLKFKELQTWWKMVYV